MKTLAIAILALNLSSLLLGCGGGNKAKDTSPKANNGTVTGLNACTGNTLSARIVGSSNPTEFRNQAAELAGIDPTYLGEIISVDLTLRLAFDSNHQVVANSSQFSLIIKDSYVGQIGTDGQPVEAIEILFGQGSNFSGSWNPAQQSLSLQVSDSYGSIQVQGQVQGEALVGSLGYQNSNGASGTLGSFQAKSCQFQ